MREAGRKRERSDLDRADADRRLTEGLKETFPASDPNQETQPGGGITSDEPAPLGQKVKRP